MSDPAIVRTRHAELSLEQVAESLPGTGEVMLSVGHCFAMCWHAAHGGNWALAAYFLRRTRGLLRGLAVIRPKYAAQIAEYDGGLLEEVYSAILARDRATFERLFAAATDQANAYHVATGHAYIRWSPPAAPPEAGLDLGPGK